VERILKWDVLETTDPGEIHTEPFYYAHAVEPHKAPAHSLDWQLDEPSSNYRRTQQGHAPHGYWQQAQMRRPHILDEFLSTFERSKEFLYWEHDWDGEGARSYSQETWHRARQFLLDGVKQLSQDCSIAIHVPRILPGPDGSIDIHWQLSDRQLLLNIPPDPDESVEYYGKKRPGHEIKGAFPLSEPDLEPLTWVKK